MNKIFQENDRESGLLVNGAAKLVKNFNLSSFLSVFFVFFLFLQANYK